MACQCRPSLHPVGDEDVEFVPGLSVQGTGEDNLFPVGREFGERCEAGEIGDLLQAGSVGIDDVKFEVPAVAFVHV